MSLGIRASGCQLAGADVGCIDLLSFIAGRATVRGGLCARHLGPGAARCVLGPPLRARRPLCYTTQERPRGGGAALACQPTAPMRQPSPLQWTRLLGAGIKGRKELLDVLLAGGGGELSGGAACLCVALRCLDGCAGRATPVAPALACWTLEPGGVLCVLPSSVQPTPDRFHHHQHCSVPSHDPVPACPWTGPWCPRVFMPQQVTARPHGPLVTLL